MPHLFVVCPQPGPIENGHTARQEAETSVLKRERRSVVDALCPVADCAIEGDHAAHASQSEGCSGVTSLSLPMSQHEVEKLRAGRVPHRNNVSWRNMHGPRPREASSWFHREPAEFRPGTGAASLGQ